MTSGSDIVVIAARRPVAVALQAVLHDWMVQGLVTPVAVVDLDSLVAGQQAVPATVLADGLATTTALQQRVAASRVARVRLAVVNDEQKDIGAAFLDRANGKWRLKGGRPK